jgi:hypothetical protein
MAENGTVASSARIGGCLRAANAAEATGFVLSGGWAVEYDWANDRPVLSNTPRRLSDLGFPPGFDRDVDGALRGQAAFAPFLYIFRGGQYARMRQSDMGLDGTGTLSAWGLPAAWTTVDAVFPGGGSREGFAYFIRGDEYLRYEWSSDSLNPPFVRKIAQGFTIAPPFTANLDGVVVGQAGFSTKAYLFATATGTVDDDGTVTAGGGHAVSFPIYARYNFDTEQTEAQDVDPVDAVSNWGGLMPLLDAGLATETALTWLDGAIAAMAAEQANPASPVPGVDSALLHHFQTGPTAAVMTAVIGRLTALRARVNSIPDRFSYDAALAVAAETIPATSTHIGARFSTHQGDNGRAAQLIHESVHFTYAGPPPPPPPLVDIPEWSGATIGGVTFGVDPISHRPYSSLTAAEALENAGSYPSLAEEIFFGADERFGEGRPQE